MSLRLVNFALPADEPHAEPNVGALVGDIVVPLAEHGQWPDAACGCGDALISLLSCPDCQASVKSMLAQMGEQPTGLPLSQVRLLPPILSPGKVFCVAGNYEEHIRESKGKNLSGEVHESDRATPRVFMKPATNTICGPGDPIYVGRTSSFVDYEGELVVIIGRKGKYLTAEEAPHYVAGVTCGNDISERRLHIWDRPETRPWDRFFDWLNGKWFDNSLPIGPCAVPLADMGDVQHLSLQTRLNGQVMQDGSTADMIFSIGELVSYISQMVTLEPGDIIATGTPSGVGVAREIAMQPGDTIEVQIEGIGCLRNPVVTEDGATA